jgi:hypothetical protein
MPEALARLERLDDLVAVDELDGALVDDEEVRCRLAVLDQRQVADRVVALDDRAGKLLELGRRQRVERGMAREERRDVGRRAQATDSNGAPSTTK